MRTQQLKRIAGLKKATFFDIIYILGFLTISVGILISIKPKSYHFEFTPAHAETIVITPAVTPTPTAGQQEIVDFIKQTFGKYAPEAFLLLTCENSALDPEKTNTFGNTPSESTDWGVFMINDHWQGVTNPAFLTDYKINTLMAWSIFSRDGYTFNQWTCGRKLGI